METKQVNEIKQTFETISENEYDTQIKKVMRTWTGDGGITGFCLRIERKTADEKTYFYEVERNLYEAHEVAKIVKNENPDDLVQIILNSHFLYTDPVIHTAQGGDSDNLLRLDIRDVDNEFPKIKFLGIQLTKKSGFLILAKHKDEFRRFPVDMPGVDRRTQIREFMLNPVKATFDRYVEIYAKLFGSASQYVTQPAFQPALVAA